MQTWYTRILTLNGASVSVSCQADSPGKAKMIFESQYAKDKILHLPVPTPI